jgi:beta-galactosidase
MMNVGTQSARALTTYVLHSRVKRIIYKYTATVMPVNEKDVWLTMTKSTAADMIRPGETWYDMEGNAIQAHGGGILFHEGIYYWFGENKNIETKSFPFERPNGKAAIRYRTDVVGVSCYSSRDLTHWHYEGLALPAVKDDPEHDLRPGNVLERPKVIYNAETGKFVMWMHIDTENYQYARAGVAVADRPSGPYRYIGSVRPNGQMSRDMTLFRDDDGQAYLAYSSEENKTLHIVLLSRDYLSPTKTYSRNFIGMSREAPAIFKHDGTYYMITSGCTGWSPNPAMLASAPSPLGPWEPLHNPCEGTDSELTFQGQSTHVCQVEGQPGLFIFMADRWTKENLGDSRYVWLPFRMDIPGEVCIGWRDSWTLEELRQ